MSKLILSWFFCAAALCASKAAAQDVSRYPDHQITIVVQAAAGGGNDALARLLASQMQKRFARDFGRLRKTFCRLRNWRTTRGTSSLNFVAPN